MSEDEEDHSIRRARRENSPKLQNAALSAAATLLMTWCDNWHYDGTNDRINRFRV